MRKFPQKKFQMNEAPKNVKIYTNQFVINMKSNYFIQEFSISFPNKDPEITTSGSDTERESPEQIAKLFRKFKKLLDK